MIVLVGEREYDIYDLDEKGRSVRSKHFLFWKSDKIQG
jgi:hypothetical protein